MVYVALQPCQAPNLLNESGKASLPVENVPLALAGGVKGTGAGEGGTAASPASATLLSVSASLSPLNSFLLGEFQEGLGTQ